MRIEYMVTGMEDDGRAVDSRSEQYLVGLDGTTHDDVATRILCRASTWAYSDLGSFAVAMSQKQLYGEFMGVTVQNDACLVDTTAYLFLSHSKELAILAFRGTGPTNIINWLANANAKMSPQAEGAVHSGFLNAGAAIIPVLLPILCGLVVAGEDKISGRSLLKVLLLVKKKFGMPTEVFSENLQEIFKLNRQRRVRDQEKDPANPPMSLKSRDFLRIQDLLNHQEIFEEEEPKKKLALYICGHSLGGAFAAMAGAVINLESSVKKHLKLPLRAIYTFGAPMFANKVLADTLDAKEMLGARLFCHRYRKDIVPRLPGRLQSDPRLGRYKHFGSLYKEKDGVWIRTTKSWKNVIGALGSNLIGVLAVINKVAPFVGNIPFIYSWVDHSPVLYMRTSESGKIGWEVMGAELSDLSDLPSQSLCFEMGALSSSSQTKYAELEGEEKTMDGFLDDGSATPRSATDWTMPGGGRRRFSSFGDFGKLR